MRINAQQPAVSTQAPRGGYHVQHVAASDLTQAGGLPNLGRANFPLRPPAPATAGSCVGGAPSGGSGGSFGVAIVEAVNAGIGWLARLFVPRPIALARPVEQAVIRPVAVPGGPTEADRSRLGQVFRVIDEDRNGRLEADELSRNALIQFDPALDEGKTEGDFVAEAHGLELWAGVTLTPQAVRAASSRQRVFDMMTAVWGTSGYCNDSSYKWWMGQLKLVGGDWDRLQETMVAYKKSIERA